jgi:hypothetical protein
MQVIFGSAVISAPAAAQLCLLAKSIRTYGGRFANCPIWAFVPAQLLRLPEERSEALEQLGVRTIEFEIDPIAQGFPFASKVMASAMAEDLLAGQNEILVWMDPDSIVFQEPEVLLLRPGKELGCRPVDHILIGSPADRPVDEFWQSIYQMNGIAEERLFTMVTSADQKRIRPYMNAGFLVVRPKQGILRRWRVCFIDALEADLFEQYFEKDILYKIFLHQAILAGVVLSQLKEQQIQIFPPLVNYPMHMHGQYPPERRPARMNQLISGRYDMFFEDQDWPDLFPSDEPLRSWLELQARYYGVDGGEK